MKCPCIVRIGSSKADRTFHIVCTLELHDANEYHHYRRYATQPVNRVEYVCCETAGIEENCGCRGDKLVDCLYKCPSGYVGVEFTSAYVGEEKKADCGIIVRRIVHVVVNMRVPPFPVVVEKPRQADVIVIQSLKKFCDTTWVDATFCQ